jgi:serine/threonine-protein kinase
MSVITRYELIDDAVGEGGFGKVQKRKDRILERVVAVKSLKLFEDAEARERFIKEAKTLARMSHAHVPAIYDVEVLDKEMRIVFEFVEGDNLGQSISDNRIPSMDQVRRWFSQIGSAIAHSHELGIIHRDIKPDNIVISPDQTTATLVDFGIALTSDDARRLTATGFVIGTPAYMSPEQSEGKDLDGRSDLYSLGITLYETLAGHLPHAGQYIDLSDANEAIPPSIDELIKKCLAQDRNHRIASAQLFIDEIRATIRADIPLSSLLMDARLHEIMAALGQLSPEDFHAKPRGQRLLILNRLKDLVRTDRPELRRATGEFMKLLLRLGSLEAENDYTPVVQSSFAWGFDREVSDKWKGEIEVRSALIEAAKCANAAAHKVISSIFLNLYHEKDMKATPGWYHHDLRRIVVALLANPNCGEEAVNLAALYDRLNQETH